MCILCLLVVVILCVNVMVINVLELRTKLNLVRQSLLTGLENIWNWNILLKMAFCYWWLLVIILSIVGRLFFFQFFKLVPTELKEYSGLYSVLKNKYTYWQEMKNAKCIQKNYFSKCLSLYWSFFIAIIASVISSSQIACDIMCVQHVIH